MVDKGFATSEAFNGSVGWHHIFGNHGAAAMFIAFQAGSVAISMWMTGEFSGVFDRAL